MRAVKHMKIALLMVIPALALLVIGGSIRPPAANAKVTKVLTLTNIFCLTMNGTGDWNNDGILDEADKAGGLGICNGLGLEINFRVLTRVVGGDPDEPKPEDFALTDRDLGQIHEDDQIMYVVAFVTNDDPVGFNADRGDFLINGSSGITCGPLAQPGYDFEDEDCDADGVNGDGVVVAAMMAKGAKRGPAEFRVRQNRVEANEPYTIVGEPHDVTLKAFDPAIQVGAPACELFSDTPSFLALVTAPETSPLTAVVTDSDGTPITGALLVYTVDDEDKASLVVPWGLTVALTPSLDLQTLGVGSPQVICGADEAGTVKVTAQITTGAAELGVALDPGARLRHSEIDLPVQSQPKAMVLSASPASLVCDGTASSTVSATLTDADGNPVVNGNLVHFQVRALGTVNPIEARSAAGVDTTAVTPLAGLTSGVAVRATLMLPVLIEAAPEPKPNEPQPLAETGFEASDLEQTILVSCEQAGPAVPEAPAPGSPGTVISPPFTGDGGGHAPSWLLALPLGTAALLLMGSG